MEAFQAQETFSRIAQHAREAYPQESCGVVIIYKGKEKYIPCENIAPPGRGDFIISPRDYMKAEDMGEVIKIIHSHPHQSPEPSMSDLVSCERSGKIWGIISFPSLEYKEFTPSGYVPPLVGRPFKHGVLDCYSLIKDYYKLELNIELPEPIREDNWWLKGQNLYLDNYEKADFVKVDTPLQKHDVILMQINSPVPNHAAIYLGDDLILHHVTDRLSSKDVYGGYWQKCTWFHIRRKEFVN